MAKQGNYVTIPGASQGWASGAGDALANLSKTLLAQSESEKERERRAALEAEDKRRYEQQREYSKGRDALLDDRFKKTSAEDKRRWELDYALRAQKEKDRKNKEGLNKTIRDAVWEYSDPSKQTFRLEDYSEPLQRSFNDVVGRLNAEKDATRSYLLGSGSQEDVVSAYRSGLETSGIPKSQIDNLVKQRSLELRGLRNELEFGGYNPKEVSSRVDSLITDTYAPRLAEVEEKIRKGSGLTQEEKVNSILRRMPENVRRNANLSDLKTRLKEVVEGPTRESLLTQEQSRTKQANETLLKNIDLYDKYIQRTNVGRKGKSNYSNNVKGVVQALKDIGSLDIGPFDNDKAREGFKVLIDSGISPEIAAASISLGVDKNIFGDSFPSVGSKEFAKIRQDAELLQRGRKVGSNGVYIDRNAYTYNPTQARGLADLQRGLIRFNQFERKPVQVDPRFSLTRGNTSTPASVLVNTGSYGSGDTAVSRSSITEAPEVSNRELAASLREVQRPVPNRLPVGLEAYNSMLGVGVRDTSPPAEAPAGRKEFLEAVDSLPSFERRLEAERRQPARFYSQRRVDAYTQELEDLKARIARLRKQL